MARQSRRKREAARFGEPALLADEVALGVFKYPAGFDPATWDGSGDYRKLCNGVCSLVRKSMIVDASNVAAWWFLDPAHEEYNYGEDVHCCALPRSPMFIEWEMPAGIYVDGTLHRVLGGVKRVGWLLADVGDSADDGRRRIFGVCVMQWHGDDGLQAITHCHWSNDATGRMVEDSPTFRYPKPGGNLQAWNPEGGELTTLIYPALLALSFMHCKNVTAPAVDPDPKMNRVRVRHGRKPFFRHHVIDIRPVRKVLETEGGLAANGLKKALHICRGHFARYTADKPLFGRTTGLVWRPAHVRGDHKQGVVSSTYRIAPIEA